MKEEIEVGVHFANKNNSTPFTNCCGTAAIDEERCPSCNTLVVGHELETRDQRRNFRFSYCIGRAR